MSGNRVKAASAMLRSSAQTDLKCARGSGASVPTALSMGGVIDSIFLRQGERHLRDFPILPLGKGWGVSSTRNEGSFRK